MIPQPPPTGSFRAAPSALNLEAAELPSASAMAETTTAVEEPQVIRPHGLRHGRWEAPSWAFWTAGGLVLAACIVYALVRLGYLRRPKT